MKHLALNVPLTTGLVWLNTLASAWCAGPVSQIPEPISAHELGAKTGAQYQGDGLSVVATPDGARLRCVFQKLEGRVTREGLWLVSTIGSQTGEKFRVVASAMGRSGNVSTLPP